MGEEQHRGADASPPNIRQRVSRFLPGWLITLLDEPRHDRKAGLSGFLQYVYKAPSNIAEAEAHREILDLGHVVVRSGWPDFMVISGPDEIYAVEVKGPGDTLRDNQLVLLHLLARAGINTYIKWPEGYEAIGQSAPWSQRGAA